MSSAAVSPQTDELISRIEDPEVAVAVRSYRDAMEGYLEELSWRSHVSSADLDELRREARAARESAWELMMSKHPDNNPKRAIFAIDEEDPWRK